MANVKVFHDANNNNNDADNNNNNNNIAADNATGVITVTRLFVPNSRA